MQKGFTIIELVTVTVVIGILVAIAMPQFTVSVERARAAEGVGLLGAIRASQLRYAAEHGGAYVPTGCTISGASNCLLDIEVHSVKNFGFPTTGVGGGGNIGTITRLANGAFGQYMLSINEAGTIACSGGAAGACAKLGY